MKTASRALSEQEQSFLKELEMIKQESKARSTTDSLTLFKHSHSNK